MMKVASVRYQQELNDYLNGVDNNTSLAELGFSDGDFFSFRRDVGADL